MKENTQLFNVVISLDQLLNTLLRGDHDVCLSSRAYIQTQLVATPEHIAKWERIRKIIDFFFGVDHCKNSYLWEANKFQAWLEKYKDL